MYISKVKQTCQRVYLPAAVIVMFNTILYIYKR